MALNHASTLIATLGSEPQVVTATLDLLLQRGEPILETVVVHTTPTQLPMHQVLLTLNQAFAQPPYATQVRLTCVSLRDGAGELLEDILSAEHAQVLFNTLYAQVLHAKQRGRRVHLSIAGGRKTMAIYGMLAAQLLFDEQDCLWHLYSSGDFLQSKRLHPQADDQVALVEVPVLSWEVVSPAFTELSRVEDAFQVVERFRRLRLQEKLERCRSFVLGALTPAEQRVVSLLVCHGLSDQELAEKLHISPRTVETHLRSAYLKAANHWALESVSRTQLIALLNWYYTQVA